MARKTKSAVKKKKVKGSLDVNALYSTGNWPVPNQIKLRNIIRSEKFEVQQQDMLEIEALQRHLYSRNPGQHISTDVLQKAYLMPIDEEKKDTFGDHEYVQRKELLMINPFAPEKKTKKKKKK